MKTFCGSLRELAIKIINFKKKKNEVINKRTQESYENAKICHICKEKFEKKYLKGKHFQKVTSHYRYRGKHRGAAHGICNLN